MDTQVTRRDFIKTAGIATGVAIAAGYSPFSYAQNEVVRVAAIGTGGQGCLHLRLGLPKIKTLQLVAVCDVYTPNLNGGWDIAVEDADPKKKEEKQKNIKKYMDYREMLEKEQFEAVIISTPLHTHYQIAMDCLDAKKYVFCEKTMCYDVEQCRNLVKKCNETGLWVQVGHQRRYNPGYNRALWLAREKGVVGRINHITAQWHRNNDWRRPVDPAYVLSADEKKWIPDLEKHINWRLYNEFSAGGLMTELATHQLDVCNWFLHTPPSRVFGYGGIDYWRDGRDVYDNVSLTYEYDMVPSNPAFGTMDKRTSFLSMQTMNRPYTVRATYTSICANAKRGSSEIMQGDKGTLELTEPACFGYTEPAAVGAWDAGGIVTAASVAKDITSGKSLQVSTAADESKEQLFMAETRHVDALQFESFANDIFQKKVPKANQMVGLLAAIVSLNGSKAMKDRTEVAIDKAQYTFDFETPDPYRYDNFPPADIKWRG
ncbi:MAG: Gfo/Idh/MocA family oxidoreductase [Candidatus Hydrogenedentes bacterium]|nr:Gfo/Idh/MocA family oxidoreductase [Candidatus Hydrogenedentota bacterium]